MMVDFMRVGNLSRVPVIDDETMTHAAIRDMVYRPMIDGQVKAFGCEPRNYAAHPETMFDAPKDMPLIPESEYSDRIKLQDETKSSLDHLLDVGDAGKPIDCLDQNGDGYCWFYSTAMCAMLLRIVMGARYVRLNPHSGASIIKQGANEGGWCGLSALFLKKYGCAPEGSGPGQWPLHSRDFRKYYTEEMKAVMAQFIILEDWYDLTRKEYDQYLTIQQVYTCLLSGVPVACDFNWWGHSVAGLRVVEVERGSFGLLIVNSWTKSWGDRGRAVLRGSKGIPNGAVALSRITASMPNPLASAPAPKPKRKRSA